MRAPNGLTESEEAAWWFNHMDELAEELNLAGEEGRLLRRSPGWFQREAEGRKLAVELGLNQEEANRAASIARKRNVALKEYLLDLVHQGIRRDSPAAEQREQAAA